MKGDDTWKYGFRKYDMIDWLVFSTNFSSISAISWREQFL